MYSTQAERFELRFTVKMKKTQNSKVVKLLEVCPHKQVLQTISSMTELINFFNFFKR